MIRRLALTATAGLLLGPFACKPPSDTADASFDVYVPGLYDGGGAGEAGDATVGDAGDGGAVATQVDRAGRPLVSVLLLPPSLQDGYNAQPSFGASLPRAELDGMESRLVELDTLDLDGGAPDPVDWPVPEGGAHPLLAVLASDVLLLDTAAPCASDAGFLPSYLDLEQELFLDGGKHSTCGGRTPDEAVTDKTLTLLVTGGRQSGTPVTQGIAGPTKAASTTFPYLAPPN